jgi:hypothetical protein
MLLDSFRAERLVSRPRNWQGFFFFFFFFGEIRLPGLDIKSISIGASIMTLADMEMDAIEARLFEDISTPRMPLERLH